MTNDSFFKNIYVLRRTTDYGQGPVESSVRVFASKAEAKRCLKEAVALEKEYWERTLEFDDLAAETDNLTDDWSVEFDAEEEEEDPRWAAMEEAMARDFKHRFEALGIVPCGFTLPTYRIEEGEVSVVEMEKQARKFYTLAKDWEAVGKGNAEKKESGAKTPKCRETKKNAKKDITPQEQ